MPEMFLIRPERLEDGTVPSVVTVIQGDPNGPCPFEYSFDDEEAAREMLRRCPGRRVYRLHFEDAQLEDIT